MLGEMNYKEFVEKFRKHVYVMPYDRQLALAIDVCKKLYIDYAAFSAKYEWGDKDVLIEAVKLVEESGAKETGQEEIDHLLTRLDAVTPDMDDFGDDYLGSYALNAAVAAYNAVQFVKDKDPEHIYDIGQCLTDTVDFKIQEIDETAEEEIDSHPLMIEARKYLLE